MGFNSAFKVLKVKHLPKLTHLELRAKHKTPSVLPYKQVAELPWALCTAAVALCRTPDKFTMKVLWPEKRGPSSAGNSDLSTYVLKVFSVNIGAQWHCEA